MTYDPKFSQKQMYDQYGRSRNTTPKVDPKPSRSSGFGGMGPDPAERFGGSPTRGIGARPPSTNTFGTNTFGGGQDNNPNRDESENKSTIRKVYENVVEKFKSFGADEPKDVIVDGKRVYQGPAFRGYDPTTRIGQFGGEYGKQQYLFDAPKLGIEVTRSPVPPTLPPSTINMFGVNTDNPRLNMFGVNRSYTRPPDPLELSVSPDIPANMDTITRNTDSKIRGITKGVMTQLPPTAEYRVDEGESLLNVVETLNAGKPTSQHVTLEEIGELNDIPNAVEDPFGKIKKGDVLRVPVKQISPTEFMDNETKAMLRDATPIKANYVLDTAYSLANQLKNFTKKSQEKYTTGGKSLGDKDRSTYKVERGDTMYDIAKREGVTLDKLIEANPDVDADKIKAGQVINIPRGRNLDELSNGLKEEIIKQDPKTETDLNVAIFNGVIKDGTFATPKVGDDPLTWIAQNTFGLNENDPEFRKAFKAITKVDPYMTPWCAAFAGHVLRNVGVELPSRAIQNPNLAFNYINLGDEVYDHNPTTNKTYAGKPSDVKAGDVVVFNNSNRDSKGNIMYGQGHISFVVDVLDDGTIIATGGNQSDGTQVATTAYTPDIVKEYYKGGYTVRRITTKSLKDTDPSIIAAITKDISVGGEER